jgi:hypothetical protein
MRHLYVAWQDDGTREWIPVALLSESVGGYSLRYTRGARRCSGFIGLGRMSDLGKIYYSQTLFPFFQNRVVSKSRPEYKSYLSWLGLTNVTEDPLSVLSVTGGLRATDSFELVPAPHKDGDQLVLDFFPRGLRHMPPATVATIAALTPGTQLYLMRDIQNSFDPKALLLRSDAPTVVIGYLAKYYGAGLDRLLGRNVQDVIVKVKQVNTDAPLDMRLLCTLAAPWSESLQFLESEDDFSPWSDEISDLSSNSALGETSLSLNVEATPANKP